MALGPPTAVVMENQPRRNLASIARAGSYMRVRGMVAAFVGKVMSVIVGLAGLAGSVG